MLTDDLSICELGCSIRGPRFAHLFTHNPYAEVVMADDLNREGMKDQIKGTVKEGEGRLRDAVGGLTGDTSEQLKGKAQQVKGKAQRKLGEIESDIDKNV